MANKNNLITVASIGVSPTPINVTILSMDEPSTRENGGDLAPGDRWFNPSTATESIYYDGNWVSIQTSK